MSVVSTVTEMVTPIVKSLGLELWDVEFKKEGSEYFLRIYIDREGGVGINDCEAVSRAIDPLLDEADPIEQSYNLEVSSAGLVRELRKTGHIKKFIGYTAEVSLYKPVPEISKSKRFSAVIKDADDETLSISVQDKDFSVNRKDISKIVVDLV